MIEERLSQLEAENQKLKEQLDRQENKKKNRRKLGWNFLKRSSGIILGAQLKKSIEKFLDEIAEQQRVSRETLSDLLSSIIIRLNE